MELEKRLVYAVLQYLQQLRGNALVSNVSDLDKAVASLSAATGVATTRDPQLQLVANNGSELSLRGLFEVAMMSAAPPAAPKQTEEERELALVPKELRGDGESVLFERTIPDNFWGRQV
jgi:hypothetical protein